ncbi:hypothetical protein [Polyangium sp. y55x31]|uniref:hypothetical protein n=1 Tax=Polyangium sp. y55x31 TaxID=3042688 RepID=UPI0024821EDC|nr:hypothetical protein [Polyangium sp. y55x31]MDI1480336.1 hypothetical protein [Polyangium sp. y55x31]
MRTNAVVISICAVLAGGACLTVSGCQGATKPTTNASALRSRGGATGYELFTLPTTWYCVSPWSAESGPERRGMETFAWRLFIAINWPGKYTRGKWKADDELKELNAPATFPRWNTWYTPEQLYQKFRENGDLAVAEDVERPVWRCDGGCLMLTLEGQGFAQGSADATKHVVYDQNGRALRYETRVDESFHDTLRDLIQSENKEFDTTFDFTHGQCRRRGPASGDSYDQGGAISIKLAWKTLSVAESKSGRFLQRSASLHGAGTAEVTLGLVGLHIAQKSNHYSDWTWATFEHVDNLASPDGARAPSFHDPTCDASMCRANASEREPRSNLCRTQITRLDPIPEDVQKLNADVRTWLAENGTVLQFYQLIGVQYTPYAGENPEPKTLRNPVIETYLVGSSAPPGDASRPSCGPSPQPGYSSCMGCHVRAQDFIFMTENSLCNCKDKRNRWIGDERCKNLGILCE